MRIAICDDEQCFVDEIANKISSYSIKNDIDFESEGFTSVEALRPNIDKFDLVFLDIRFGSQNVGIEWAKSLREENSDVAIIICSSLKDQLINGYRAEAIRFLLKPICETEIFEALDACRDKFEMRNKNLVIKSDFKEVLIPVSKIAYIESVSRRRKIVLVSKEEIFTGDNLSSIFDKLDKHRFKYTHKSIVVSLGKVDKVLSQTILLVTGDEIPISRQHIVEFKRELRRFMGGSLV